jgi:hypothetical protein
MTVEKSAAGDIRAKLAQLRELRDQLDAHDVALNDLVPEVEKMFKSLHLGVSISMRIEEGDTWARWLTFEKMSKQWRLCQVTGPLDGDPDDYTTTPVSDLPRDTRAKILGYDVPRLLDAGVEHMEKRIEERRRVIDSTNELLETVGEFVANGEEPREQQPLSLLHEAALGLATGTRVGTVTLHPPMGQALPALTLPGELPGPPAVPVKPVTVPTGNPFYDLTPNVVPSGPVYTKIVDDGTGPKRGKVHKKWKKL